MLAQERAVDTSFEREIRRCRREIAAVEAELLAGNPDVAGLCLALSDWNAELRILQRHRSERESGAASGS